ncbi:MAG: LLM class flavin-dependent oxidoreductase [Beijerinckiaceae bacterium]|nr:LLM class flavin-dependent oxidoreductase [Beijerinckiaceae bacterium]
MTMQFGLYAPIPMAAVGSPEMAKAAREACEPLAQGATDPQYHFGLELLQTAEAAGFNLALFAERHLGHDLSAFVNASSLASRLQHMRALVAVHPGLWDPVMVAKLIASMDRICAGRVALNIVNGWFDREFEMFGGKVLQGEERYRRTTEFIEIMRGLWREETFSYEGEHYRVDKGQLLLKPGSARPPEMYSVSTSDRGRDFIAETCDWWFVEFPKSAENYDEVMRSLEASIADMNRRTARLGRRVRYALNPFLALGSSPEQALQTTVDRIFAHSVETDSRKIQHQMLPATKGGCVGTPADVRRQVGRFSDMGFELLLLKLIPSLDNIREIGAEVIAPLRSSGGVRADATVSG